jgi:hypothetical protein
MTDHVSRETLQLMADGELSEEAVRSVRLHVGSCDSCQKAYRSLVQFDRLMRNMPVRSLSQEFTNRVLARLGIQQRTPFLFRVLEHFASLVAVFFVAALGGTVWAVLALSSGQGSGGQSVDYLQPLEAAGTWLTASWSEFAQWMHNALLQLPEAQAVEIFLMIILTAFVVAVIDRVVQRRGMTGRS